MTATKSDYRITERNNETDDLVRVVATLTAVTFREATFVKSESIASDGNHIRLEKWHPDSELEFDYCGWEYL